MKRGTSLSQLSIVTSSLESVTWLVISILVETHTASEQCKDALSVTHSITQWHNFEKIQFNCHIVTYNKKLKPAGTSLQGNVFRETSPPFLFCLKDLCTFLLDSAAGKTSCFLLSNLAPAALLKV